MKVDYIRREVPAEISEEGGAYIQLVGKQTVGLSTSIKEAITNLYCVGEPSMIEGYFVGIMRSVFEGIQADGHPRSVGDVQFYPVCGGQFDLEKGWDPLVNDVRIKARLINGVTLDVTNWAFRDVTEGRVAFSIDNVCSGADDGIVTNVDNTEINGKNFPAKALLTVEWACGVKGGVVPANKFTSTVSRITIDKSVYENILASTDDGAKVTYTVKGCYNKAQKTATLEWHTPVVNPSLTSVTMFTPEGSSGPQMDGVGVNLHAANETAGESGWTVSGMVGRIKTLDGTLVAGSIDENCFSIAADRKSFSSLWNMSGTLTVGTKYKVELDMLKGDNTPITVTQEFTYTEPA